MSTLNPTYCIVRIGILAEHQLQVSRIVRFGLSPERAQRLCHRLNLLAQRRGRPCLFATMKAATVESEVSA
jgi:hypothetical protein